MLFGDFSILLKLNRYLRAVLQRIKQAVIVVDGNFINHSVPELFVKLDVGYYNLGSIYNPHTQPKKLGTPIGVPSFFFFGCREEMGFEPHELRSLTRVCGAL